MTSPAHNGKSPDLTVRAYAKVNLTLDVFSKRADGYHSIASVMQAVSLFDTLEFHVRSEPGIHFSHDAGTSSNIPADDTNLVVRAAKLVLAASSEAHISGTCGLAIHLRKLIPSQAGLGGGSSDAAATLIAVNHLLKLQLTERELHRCAAALGSDVPFFLNGGTAVARGRGELIQPIAAPETLWLVIVKPEESVSTAWAYGQLDFIPERQSNRATSRLQRAIEQGDRDRLIAFQCNDFELPVFEHHKSLSWLHDELIMAGGLAAHLCGSGSALYTVMPDESTGRRAAELMRNRYPNTFVARTLTAAESHPISGAD